MPSISVKEKISKHSPARRCLFGQPPNAESNDCFVKRLLDEIHEAYKAKWEFDFIADEPIQTIGDKHHFSYERVSEESVPGFYRLSSYSPVCPPLPLKSFEKKLSKFEFDIEEMDSENVDPRHLSYRHHYYTTPVTPTTTAPPTLTKIFNNSYNSSDDSFDEDDANEEGSDKHLLNNNTSISSNSCSNESIINLATEKQIDDLNDSCQIGKFNSDDNNCSNSSTSLSKCSSILRGSILKNTVTPKKQTKLTEFMTHHRKSLQRSSKKSDIFEAKTPNSKSLSPRHKRWKVISKITA